MSKTLHVYLDSTYRFGGSTNNFSYNLQDPIRAAKYFKVSTAEIPFCHITTSETQGRPTTITNYTFPKTTQYRLSQQQSRVDTIIVSALSQSFKRR